MRGGGSSGLQEGILVVSKGNSRRGKNSDFGLQKGVTLLLLPVPMYYCLAFSQSKINKLITLKMI